MSYYDRTGWLSRGRTIGEYWDRAVSMNADGIAFVDTVEGEEFSVTYQQADKMVNSVRYSISILAINYIGAVWVPLHAFLRFFL